MCQPSREESSRHHRRMFTPGRIVNRVDVMECEPQYEAALRAVSAVFGSIGRVFICLDEDFRVVHASTLLRRLIGDELAASIVGHPAADLLGEDLFGPNGRLRQLLTIGEVREGWRAVVHAADGTLRVVSVTAAPLVPDESGVCDPRVKYIIVIRPAEED